MKQLDLFEYKNIVSEREQLEKLKDDINRMRKALFMQMAACKKECQDVAQRQTIIELNLCRGKIY